MKKVIYLLACVAFLGCYSCSDDDDGLKMQDISVEFAVSDAGMDGTGIDLGIKLSRATKESLDVTVQMISTEVSESDITVTPALTNGQVVVNIPAAYALSRRDLCGKKLFTIYYLIPMFFTGGLIPTYLVVKDFNLLDNFS